MHRVLRFLMVPLLILAIGCTRDSGSLVKNGNKFFDKTKYKEASILYRSAIKKDPKNGEAYYRLGLAAMKMGDWGTAAQALRRAVDLQPANNDAAAKLADIYWMAYVSDTRKYKSVLPEVQELSDSLLKRDPKSFDGLRLAGYTALANQNVPGALEKFTAANQSKPLQPELCMVLVQTLLASNRTPEAEKLAKDVIAKEKTFAPMYDQLLMIYLRQNQLAEAEQLLKTKVANNPKQEGVYLQLAGFYIGVKRDADMERTLQQLLSNPKDFPLGHLTVGRFFFRFRNFDRARREYEEGMKQSKEKAAYQKATVELLAAQGKSAEARVIVNEILKDNPKDVQGIEMRSALQLQGGNPQEVQTAVNDLQSLVSKAPDNPIYRFELARALLAKKAPDQARVHLEEAIRLRPDFVPAKLSLAQLLSVKGEHGKALQAADEVLRAEPNNLQAHLLRSSALIGIGEQTKAKAELDQILKAAPNSTDARFQLGLINFNEKNYKAADAIFRQMQEAAPNDSRGMIGIVETQVAQHEFNSAIQMMENELKKDPNRQEYRLALANVKVRAEKYDAAIQDFQILTKQNPKSVDLVMRLAETYRLKGDLNQAIDNFRKAAALDNGNPVPLIRLGMLLDGIGRRAEAKPIYEQVLRLRPDEPVALNNLAFIKAEEGSDLDQALSLAQRAKQAMPLDPNVSDTLGWVYIKKNLSEDAIRVLRDLVGKEPKNATYRFHLAMALLQKGDRNTARKECETALQSNPSKEEQEKIHALMVKIG